jgi:pimeloyl-ACP methyl ester carboxylesterase
MGFEQELIHRLEAADALELARLIASATAEEERVLRLHLGDERFRRMREQVVLNGLTSRKRAARGNVVVLHGIMGAELSSYQPGDEDLLWLNFLRIIRGRLSRLRLSADGVTDASAGWTVRASGMLKKYYGELLLWLADGWAVKPFYFDWRKGLDLAAADLNDRILAWFGQGNPVHLVAHSMGGLVARTFIANHPETWQRMWDEPSGGRSGGRLLMLGTPNHGSFAIPQVIAGIEPLVRKLGLADLVHDLPALRQIFNTFPGSLHMLPSPFKYPELQPLYEAGTYGALGISQHHLTAALDHHAKLRAVIEPDRMTYVAGYNQPTFSYVAPTLEAISNVDAYAVTQAGDGRVPHALGRLDRVTTYFIETDHGGLSEDRRVFELVSELLEHGKARAGVTQPRVRATSLRADRQRALRAEILAQLDAEAAQLEPLVARRTPRAAVAPAEVTEDDRRAEELIVRGVLGSPAGVERNAAAAAVAAHAVHTGKPKARPARVTVRLVPGSIEDVNGLAVRGGPVDAVAVGHYVGVAPQAAEKVIDDQLTAALSPAQVNARRRARGVIAQFTERGVLRGALGEQFFINDPRSMKGKASPRLITLVGLGEPGRLGVPELTVAIRELCWSLGQLGKHHLATVLIGAGPGNLSIADAVNAWLRGVRRALVDSGASKRSARGARAGVGLRRISLVEHDPRRIQEIATALAAEQASQRAAGLDVDLELPTSAEQRRWSTQLKRQQARGRADSAGSADAVSAGSPPTLVTVRQDKAGYVFAALTESASVPERTVAVDAALVLEANQQLAIASDTPQQLSFGRILLNLIAPHDLRPHLRSSAPLVVVVDATTARLHWEMMADGEADGEARDAFLATGRGFTRRLRTAFAPPPEPPPTAARTLRVLVVADPAGDDRLPGAALEGMQVARLFTRFNDLYATSEHEVEVTRLLGPREATRLNVLVALTQGRYDVLHFAGHCVFDPENIAESGWIFTDGARLTARELNRIDRIPPFIFSNACESGITPERSTARPVAAAPSFAEAFFARGVSNFICTAWEVDDEAARLFATALYTELLGLQGSRAGKPGRFASLSEALRVARSAIFDTPGGITTWGAYQHYGTPAYRFFEAGSERGRS